MKDAKIKTTESHIVPSARAPPIIEGVSKPSHSVIPACSWQESTQKIDILEWVPDRNTPARNSKHIYTHCRPAWRRQAGGDVKF